ncbi:5-formyltetrahydrofolate cyclo-ligase [Azospirillum formosense]|uniref:5-formyltetrahydrofolate cyclo-ligase n=1 Tax=Azospirillum formosense TaxID=861533 RepID=A0ABX2L052_9PROT|nr:5-formyltetrahydrofolate cyclo-ligase [Azospirillum formosense]MBY3753367.1 5-formyltetrahydrofolate cyclo-ligase [Azospirillum formosense]NUB22286.1 5-formyltetrahydrofolate cyclo-ligase [Azospirillum formosense]
MSDPRAAKDAARAQARARRDSLSDDRLRAFAADALRDRFLEELVRPGFIADGPVAGYWPLGSELDVRPLLLHLRTGGRSIALPVSGPRGQALTFRDWDPVLPLAAGRYGIQEPGADRPEVVPAVLLVPMLAFDRSGHRLGYGAGYYDRTLDALRAIRPVLAVGMAFAVQEMDAVPHGAHDERLDWILTERETLRFTQ